MDESEKQTLLGKLFDGNYIDKRPEKKLLVYHGNISLNHKLMRFFIRDIFDAYVEFQARHDEQLKFIAHMPYTCGLAAVVSQELGADIASYNERDGLIYCERNTDYIFLAHCIAHGNGLKRAASALEQMDSRIVFAICMYDAMKHQKIADELGISVHSTINKDDVRNYYNSKSIGAV